MQEDDLQNTSTKERETRQRLLRILEVNETFQNYTVSLRETGGHRENSLRNASLTVMNGTIESYNMDYYRTDLVGERRCKIRYERGDDENICKCFNDSKPYNCTLQQRLEGAPTIRNFTEDPINTIVSRLLRTRQEVPLQGELSMQSECFVMDNDEGGEEVELCVHEGIPVKFERSLHGPGGSFSYSWNVTKEE